MADLERKKKIRQGHRGVARKRLTEAKDIVEAEGPVDSLRVEQVKAALKDRLEILRKCDEEILNMTEDEDQVITEIEESDEFNEVVSRMLVLLDNHIKTSTAKEVKPQDSMAKLPKLNLPVFTGDIMEWFTFWDSYEAAVHNNSSLSDIQKFTYLKSLLIRSASEAIAGLALTASNYKEAIEVLKGRFGNRERIISKHMEALLNLNDVTSNGNTSGLRTLHDKVETHIRELQALGVAAEAYNCLLPSVLMKKLPQELCLSLSRKIAEADWNLDNLMRQFSEELQARERAERSHNSGDRKSVNESRHKVSSRVPPTSAALHTRGYNSCCYCEGNHASEACGKVVDVDARKRIIRENNRCYVCLKRGHIGRVCHSNGRCSRCRGRHHTSICYQQGRKSESKESEETDPRLNPKAPPFKSTSLLTEAGDTILLQTARAVVKDPDSDNKAELRLIFDSGSQRSYITDRARELLALRIVERREMIIATFGSNNGRIEKCDVVRVGVPVDKEDIVFMKLLTVPIISEPVKGMALQQHIQQFGHLQGLQLADDINDGDSVEFDVLVGLDYYWQFISGEIIHGRTGPTAVHSRLGWLLSGPVVSSSTALCTRVLTNTSCERVKLEEQLHQFWDLESLGIVDKECNLYEQFTKRVTFDGTRYEVSLPWKESVVDIPSNFTLCLRRLKSLVKRLRSEPVLFTEYDKVIQEQVEKGIVERVKEPEKADGDKVHYLPHHAVIRQDKETTKVRVVYDASAKENGLSLNECLHVGTNLNQGIFQLLVRFRLHKVGFVADVEKAFLMVAVQREDRDALRFLWVKDIHEDPPQWEVLRFARVTFGVAPSPFLLNATIRYHIECYRESNPDVANKLLRSMYVDDVVSGGDSKEEVKALFERFRGVLKEGGFNLRKFLTNCTNADDVDDASGELTKVLGINWDIRTDELVLDVRSIVDSVDVISPTKRHIVSVISKVYDPVGFLSPITIRLKIFLQLLHKAKVKWEERVEGELLSQWLKIVSSMREATPIALSRCVVKVSDVNRYDLCGFCDASACAYGAVIYLRCISQGSVNVELIASKSRVAPLKEQSIPRLELLGALLLARLMNAVSQALAMEIPLSDPVGYTDSLVTLYWIKGTEKSWKPFVENRVREIRKLLPEESWKHCPGAINPADLPSRGLTPRDLTASAIWFQGPEFLKKEPGEVEIDEARMPEACVQELRASDRDHVLLTHDMGVRITEVIDIQRYSCLERLLRVTAYVLKFVAILKSRVTQNAIQEGRMLFSSQILLAERLWIQEAQSRLNEDKRFRHEKKQLQLFQDENGLWRCGGRLENANLSYDTKHPVLLPGKHYFTTLLVWRSHYRVFHNGVKETLAEIRGKFWIVRGRRLVRKILHKCVICRRVEGGPYGAPKAPPLPTFRVSEEPPFTHTGVDFAGPLFIKGGGEGGERKVWLCLYTCCVVRGVHLDLLSSMSLDSFLRSFKRFVARRGLPSKVISDNAKTFKAAAKLFKQIMSHRDINHYLPGARIQWVFNVEKAPWWGGVYERLIRSTKRCLRKAIGRATLSYDELITLVAEVEMIINSRPLSYMNADDLQEPITPSHLMIGRRINNLPDNVCYGSDEDEDYTLTRSDLTRRMKHFGRMLDHFWSRWKLEYLIELREAHRYKSGETPGNEVSIGDVVIVHKEDKRRGFWDLARIEEMITGKDGLTRAAVVRVADRKGGYKTLRRPLQRLYPIEAGNTLSQTNTSENNNPDLNVQLDPNRDQDNSTDGEPNNLEESSRLQDDVISPAEDRTTESSVTEPDSVGPRRSTRAAGKEARIRILAQSLS